jgi:hypothetical protein
MFAPAIPVSPSLGLAAIRPMVGPRTLWANWMDNLARQATLLVMKLLIIAGAYLVGSLLGTLLAVVLNRWVFRKKMPEVGKQLCSLICGVLLALLAALFVLGSGGNGLFGGGGGGEGSGENPTQTEGSSTGNTSPQEPVETPSPPQVTSPPQREVSKVIRVTVLAGAAVQKMGHFYLLEDDPTPRTFAEITDAILQRRPKTSERWTLWILFPADPNLAPPPNDPKVTRLVDWARQEAGLDVTFPTRPR